MAFFSLFILLVVLALIATRLFLALSPAQVAGGLRGGLPVFVMALGGLLTLVGRGAIGLPVAAGGFAWWRRTRATRPAAAGASSAVRSDWFEMTLDHDTGAMNGRILRDPFAGSMLDDLDEDRLRDLATRVAADGDPESERLLEAYLDRRMPGWRDGPDGDEASGLGGAPGSGAVGEKEAHEILGLAPGATEAEIREAHRRLMKRAHPDAGGSAELAARLNEAKDVLLRLHR